MTKYQFCTYFDKDYLFRGLALYNSLLKHCPDFTLWVLCMDELTYQTLQNLNLKNLELIALKDFEDPQLLAAKGTRTIVEYYWTCTPSLPLFILNKHPALMDIAYLDADMYFFGSPQPIYEGLGNKSIMIISHRYSPDLKYLEKESGIYNVGMLIFKNDENGRRCLKWWREKCLEWCYAYYDNGRYGDQMYLNDWPTRFPGVHVLEHKGADLAPWNIAQYEITLKDGEIFVDQDPLIFYHFHHVTIYSPTEFLTHKALYQISSEKVKLVYQPYIAALEEAIKTVQTVFPNFAYGFTDKPPLMKKLKKILTSVHRKFKQALPGYAKIYDYIKNNH